MRSNLLINRVRGVKLPGLIWLTGCVFVCSGIVRAENDAPAESRPPSEQNVRFFETKIRPLLADHCYECHGADSQKSGLRLDTTQGIVSGGHSGPSIVAGKPDGSVLLTAVRYLDSDLRMPPDDRLSQEQIADLTRWIESGAPLPDTESTTWNSKQNEIDLDAGRNHWSFRPVVDYDPPRFADGPSPRHPVDAFLSKPLRHSGLVAAPPANRRTLIRRATFDLIGLPPTPREVESFLRDDSPLAFQHVVDRLLASPRYGERWGRRWLDVARYADSNGLDENVAHGNAWRYRDYVVASLNDDKPYNEFLTEQLAGDLLDSNNDTALRNERLIATGYLVLGPKVLAEQDQDKMRMDIIDEQLDTIGRSILGLTLGCARCHTHKFDPISHHDYHGLAGILQSTQTMDSYETVAEWHENRIETHEQTKRRERHETAVALLEKQIKNNVDAAIKELGPTDPSEEAKQDSRTLEKQFPKATQQELKRLRDELKTLQDSEPDSPMAMGVVDSTVIDTPIHLRGSHLTLGDVVPRRFPEVLVSTVQTSLPDQQSGRLELARWLTSGTHPLTARVMVNRIWRGHFGKGLVSTLDNFGIQGDPPTHPELLDWLATEFVRSGWSLKSLHRTIMLSDAYQRSSQGNEANQELDVGNRLYWRFDLQRLEAEAIRDGMLAIANQLDSEMGGSLLELKNREYVFNHTSKDNSSYDTSRRSIYVPVIRNHLFDLFKLFDYTDASVLNGDRDTSTIAPQALFMMNSNLVAKQASALADRLLRVDTTEASRLRSLYEIAYSRPPSSTEVRHAESFLRRLESLLARQPSGIEKLSQQRTAWQALCQSIIASSEFIYVR